MASIVRFFKGRTLGGLFKQGWDEIPEVVGSTFMAFIGIGLAGIAIYNYHANDGENRRYKMEYIVYRPDDPRAAKVKLND